MTKWRCYQCSQYQAEFKLIYIAQGQKHEVFKPPFCENSYQMVIKRLFLIFLLYFYFLLEHPQYLLVMHYLKLREYWVFHYLFSNNYFETIQNYLSFIPTWIKFFWIHLEQHHLQNLLYWNLQRKELLKGASLNIKIQRS